MNDFCNAGSLDGSQGYFYLFKYFEGLLCSQEDTVPSERMLEELRSNHFILLNLILENENCSQEPEYFKECCNIFQKFKESEAFKSLVLTQPLGESVIFMAHAPALENLTEKSHLIERESSPLELNISSLSDHMEPSVYELSSAHRQRRKGPFQALVSEDSGVKRPAASKNKKKLTIHIEDPSGSKVMPWNTPCIRENEICLPLWAIFTVAVCLLAFLYGWVTAFYKA